MSTAMIPLTRGYAAVVDAADVERVMRHKWSAQPVGHTVYAQRSIRRDDGRWTTQRMHTFLTGYAATDHRNGNGLDNRRVNLREATQAQNMANRRREPSSSGFKGVTWAKRHKSWKAQIGVRGTRRHLGYYSTAEDAARAYDEVARDVHGEFATLNFPRPGERPAALQEAAA